jgi:hypothetical protein
VWPFETGFTRRPTPERSPAIVHAEVWPGVVGLRRGGDEIRDASQVKALVAEIARRDEDGTLADLFAPPRADADAAREEGWILGT